MIITLRPRIDPDLMLYFQAILTDQRGDNLRNKNCHGLLNEEDFEKLNTSRLIHVLICIGNLKQEEKQTNRETS